jgi:hypothetical protein
LEQKHTCRHRIETTEETLKTERLPNQPEADGEVWAGSKKGIETKKVVALLHAPPSGSSERSERN